MQLDSQKDGMLWEISGNGLSHKSYLFGTMHGDGHNYKLEEIFTAFPQLREILGNVSCILTILRLLLIVWHLLLFL